MNNNTALLLGGAAVLFLLMNRQGGSQGQPVTVEQPRPVTNTIVDEDSVGEQVGAAVRGIGTGVAAVIGSFYGADTADASGEASTS